MLVTAVGSTLREAFANAALAVLGLFVDPSSVREREVREVRAHGATPEALLIQWVSECLYIHDVEGFVSRRIDFVVFDAEPRAGGEPLRLHGFLHGEQLDPARHKIKTAVKETPPRSVSIQCQPAGFAIALEMAV
jgi:SHS2 domain-containing protein